MKTRMACAIGAAFIAFAAGSASAQQPMPPAQPTAAGLWQQTDDSGRVGAWFLIYEGVNGIYEGALARSFPKPGDNPNPICTKCTGAQKNQPVLGLVIIKNMRPKKGAVATYENGTILDPRDGSVYKANIEVSPDNQKLTLRGYIGVPMFGQSQVWTRLPDTALPAAEAPANLQPILAQLSPAPAAPDPLAPLAPPPANRANAQRPFR